MGQGHMSFPRKVNLSGEVRSRSQGMIMLHAFSVLVYGLKPKVWGRVGPDPWAELPSGWVDLELCPRVWSNPDTNRGL